MKVSIEEIETWRRVRKRQGSELFVSPYSAVDIFRLSPERYYEGDVRVRFALLEDSSGHGDEGTF